MHCLDIANQFNQHFTNIGPTLLSSIGATNGDLPKYINNTPQNSFYLSTVTKEYVTQLLLSNLSDNKALLDIPIRHDNLIDLMMKLMGRIIIKTTFQCPHDTIIRSKYIIFNR